MRSWLFLLLAAMPLVGAEEGHGGEHEESLSEVIMHHISNSEMSHPLLQEWGITMAAFMMICATLVLIILFGMLMRKSSDAPRGFSNALEILVLFVRDEIAIANMGETWGRRFTPFLLTLFFFILTCNLLGLIPGSFTATSNLNVTGTLALISFATFIISGLVALGPIGYFKHMVPAGTPIVIAPVIVILEVISIFVRPIALTIRLGANMTAGHIVILVMLGFIFVLKSVLAAPVAIGFAAAITILEMIVAFIQAYVFTLLTSIYVGMVVHSHH